MKDENWVEDEQRCLPDLTVIVPVWNRIDIIGKCLDALEKQETKTARFETVVVDDGSDDGTREFLDGYIQSRTRNLQVIRHLKPTNAGVARNAGLKNARARIVLFLDADVVLKPNVIETHVGYHRRYPDNNVVILGNVKFPDEWPPTVIDELGNCAVQWRNLKPHSELPWWNFFTTHISAKKNFLLSAGGFDDRLERFEDIELGLRLMPMGLKIIYVDEAVGFHYHRRTPKELVLNAKAYGIALTQQYNSGDPAWRDYLSYHGGFEKGWKTSTKRAIGTLLSNRVMFPATLWAANALTDRFPGISVLLCRALRYHSLHTAFRPGLKRSERDER